MVNKDLIDIIINELANSEESIFLLDPLISNSRFNKHINIRTSGGYDDKFVSFNILSTTNLHEIIADIDDYYDGPDYYDIPTRKFLEYFSDEELTKFILEYII